MDKPQTERITQGPAFIEITRGKTTLPRPRIYAGTDPLNCKQVAEASDKANAELIAEAFNVTHETGLTPRQLARELDELRAALKDSQDLLAEVYKQGRAGSLIWMHFPQVSKKNIELLNTIKPCPRR